MEPHVLSLWLCLKDPVVEVRITALTCLVELLQGNYIKLRGTMYFLLLSMLCDLDENVVELATCFLRDYLVATNKTIMYEHFVDALFHFNGYQVSLCNIPIS
jgi:condensin-2 complex subunit D3